MLPVNVDASDAQTPESDSSSGRPPDEQTTRQRAARYLSWQRNERLLRWPRPETATRGPRRRSDLWPCDVYGHSNAVRPRRRYRHSCQSHRPVRLSTSPPARARAADPQAKHSASRTAAADGRAGARRRVLASDRPAGGRPPHRRGTGWRRAQEQLAPGGPGARPEMAIGPFSTADISRREVCKNCCQLRLAVLGPHRAILQPRVRPEPLATALAAPRRPPRRHVLVAP
jgi:hypothetical protein